MNAEYRVCRGALFVNDERVPVNGRILKIGLVAAGLEPSACDRLDEKEARRILHLERSFLLSGLARELRRAFAPDRAA